MSLVLSFFGVFYLWPLWSAPDGVLLSCAQHQRATDPSECQQGHLTVWAWRAPSSLTVSRTGRSSIRLAADELARVAPSPRVLAILSLNESHSGHWSVQVSSALETCSHILVKQNRPLNNPKHLGQIKRAAKYAVVAMWQSQCGLEDCHFILVLFIIDNYIAFFVLNSLP